MEVEHRDDFRCRERPAGMPGAAAGDEAQALGAQAAGDFLQFGDSIRSQ